jgi:hypothetical protein
MEEVSSEKKVVKNVNVVKSVLTSAPSAMGELFAPLFGSIVGTRESRTGVDPSRETVSVATRVLVISKVV